MSAAETSESPVSSGTRFGYLLAALVFFLVTTPFAMHTTLGQYRFRVLFSLVLIGGVATMRSRRKILIAAFLAVPAIAGNWIATVSQIEHVHVFTYSVSAIFLAYITVTIMVSLLSETQVTSDTVLGGVCVYLLVGVVWLMLYSLAIQYEPNAILSNGAPLSALLEEGPVTLLYFSFVTLTTLGYGDVVPNSSVARMLASGEAITGQLFVAILIARLVGMHAAQSRDR